MDACAYSRQAYLELKNILDGIEFLLISTMKQSASLALLSGDLGGFEVWGSESRCSRDHVLSSGQARVHSDGDDFNIIGLTDDLGDVIPGRKFFECLVIVGSGTVFGGGTEVAATVGWQDSGNLQPGPG